MIKLVIFLFWWACTFVLCFVPLLLRVPDQESLEFSELDMAYLSTGFRYSLVASISVGVKLLINFIMGVIISRNSAFSPQLVLIMSLLIPNYVMLLETQQNVGFVLLQCIMTIRTIAEMGSFLLYIESKVAGHGISYLTVTTFIFYSSATSIRNISYVTTISTRIPLWSASVVLYAISVMGLILICKSWLHRIDKIFQNSEGSMQHHMTRFFIVCVALTAIIHLVLRLCVGIEWLSTTSDVLTASSYAELAFVVLVFYVQSTLVERELHSIKVKLYQFYIYFVRSYLFVDCRKL